MDVKSFESVSDFLICTEDLLLQNESFYNLIEVILCLL